jgi:hypothetical protein
MPVTLPNTVAGCQKYWSSEGGYCGTGGSCTDIRGGSATWVIRDKVAADVLSGGFSADVVWMGVNEQRAADESIEVGVTWGWKGQPVWAYYTAWHKLNGGYWEFNLGGIPSVGTPVSATVVSCAESPFDPGCTTPWNPSTADYEHVARINGFVAKWNKTTIAGGGFVAPKFGSRQVVAGMESTCSSFPGNLNPPSKSEPTTFRMFDYRLGLYWSNIENLGTNYYTSKTPPTSTIHDVGCCYGLIPNSTRCYAAPDADFFTYLNATTPLVCQ